MNNDQEKESFSSVHVSIAILHFKAKLKLQQRINEADKAIKEQTDHFTGKDWLCYVSEAQRLEKVTQGSEVSS